MKQFLLLAFLFAAFAPLMFAQADEMGKNELAVWGGYSPDSSTLVKGIGRTEDARFGIIAFRYSRRFNNSDTYNLKYTADVVPASFLNYPDSDGIPIFVSPSGPIAPSPVRIRETRYAFGAAPLGLQINFRPRKRVQPFIGASGGMLFFNKRTPNLVGTRFAFTADIGAGIEFRLKERRSVTVGYKYYHISNGDRGIENPGFDNNLFYIGYTFFSR